MAELLRIEAIDVRYGDVQVVWGCSLEVRAGETVALFGGNGAGKTTTLRAISGLIAPSAGRILFDGHDISRLPAHRLPDLGVAHVPEGRHVFPRMTVEENLDLGAYAPRSRPHRRRSLATVYELFPVLRERRASQAGAPVK